MDFEYKMEITADPEEVFAALTNPFQNCGVAIPLI